VSGHSSSTPMTGSRSSASTIQICPSGRPPGAGAEEGEDDAAALARELREELGLELVAPPGRCVWVRTHVPDEQVGRPDGAALLPRPDPGIRDPSGALARGDSGRGLGEHRWWTLEELEAARRRVRAAARPDAAPRAASEGPGAEPVDVGV